MKKVTDGQVRAIVGAILACYLIYSSWSDGDWQHVGLYTLGLVALLAVIGFSFRGWKPQSEHHASRVSPSEGGESRLSKIGHSAPPIEASAPQERAKVFLINKIANQAEREGAPLTSLELRMLHWSADHEDPVLAEEFGADHDDAEFEMRIHALFLSALKHDLQAVEGGSKEQKAEAQKPYRTAIEELQNGDHYLSVIIESPGQSGGTLRGWGRLIRVIDSLQIGEVVVASCILLLVWGAMYVASERYGWPHWCVAMSVLSVVMVLVALRLGWAILSPRGWTDRRILILVFGLVLVVGVMSMLVQVRLVPPPALFRVVFEKQGPSLDWLVAAGLGVALVTLVAAYWAPERSDAGRSEERRFR